MPMKKYLFFFLILQTLVPTFLDAEIFSENLAPQSDIKEIISQVQEPEKISPEQSKDQETNVLTFGQYKYNNFGSSAEFVAIK